MFAFTAEALMFALYAGFVFYFVKAMYFQTRIIVQMFRVFYDSFRLLPWRAYTNRAITRENAAALKQTASYQVHLTGLIAAAKLVGLFFVAFFCLASLCHLILPQAEFWLLHL